MRTPREPQELLSFLRFGSCVGDHAGSAQFDFESRLCDCEKGSGQK